MQFQMQVGIQGRKRQGAKLTEKRTRGCHAVSSASRGSREGKHQGRQIDGEKGREGAMQFQVQARAPGKKRQGHQIDGEKDERCAMQFQVQAGAPEKKRQGHQIDGEKDERCAMQFQVQARDPGMKTSGAPNWRRKGREGRHAVSSASRGSRQENVRGAKLTEKGTRGAPCSFKCKQGLQGRKRQGRQIDREMDERCAMQFQVKVGAPEKKTSGAPNWWRKGREGRHAVSNASRGSREENVRATN